MATPDRGGGSGDDHADHADGAIICPWRTAEFYDQECSLFFDCPSHVVERALEDEAGPSRPGNSDNAGEESSRSAAEPPAPVTAGGAGGVGGAAAGAEVGSAAAAGNAGDWTAARLPHPREESPGEGNMSSVEPPEPRRRNPEEQDVEGEEDDDQPMTLGEFVRAFPSQAAAAGSSRSGHEQRTAVVSRPNRTNADGSSPLEVSGQASGGQQQQQQQQVRSATEALAQRDEAGESPRPRAPSHRLSAGTESQSPRQTLSATQPSPADARQPADDRRGPPPIVLPRWQPDAEVTYCPICHSQFSIFLRKHHCRKCGRVVCASCSPHRITIPYQYIVQPPGQPQRYSGVFLGGEGSLVDFNSVGGGERVRLCNPCVPDPNITPPNQVTGGPGVFPQRAHYRSQSSTGGTHPGDMSSRALAGSAADYSRSRSVTVHNPTANSRHLPAEPTSNRILTGTPPPGYFFYGHNQAGAGPSSAGSSSSSAQLPYRPANAGSSSGTFHSYQYAQSQQRQSRRASGSGGGASSSSNAPLPPAPRPPAPPHHQSNQQYLIPEEDECPVCHRELPRRTLPNWEALREAHVAGCIVAHSSYSGVPRSAGAADGSSSSASSGATPPPIQGHSSRTTGMFPYLATEKDCVDSAECTICLEEFEVGVPMARLECLCRFHRRCIQAWFVGHPGRCPVHQHDSFGF